MFHRLLSLSAVVAVAAVAAAPLSAPADSSGLAWDSVTKLAQTTDPASVQPGSFDSDYAAASAVVVSTDSGGGGFMAKIRAAEQAMKGAAQIIQTGLAEKHYVAGSKERTDQVSYGTATIRDCGARTITTLDLRKKTYKVESMDHPSQPPNGGAPAGNATPGPAPTDDGTRVALDVRNTALGAKQVGGQATQGYRSAIKMTSTKPSGETHVANINMIAYYSNLAQPVVLCSTLSMPHVPGPPQGQGAAMLGSYTTFLQAMAHPLSGRVTFTQSGPALQLGRLAMFDAVAFTGENASRGEATFVGERGNVRSISASDASFSVPSDFTKEQ